MVFRPSSFNFFKEISFVMNRSEPVIIAVDKIGI